MIESLVHDKIAAKFWRKHFVNELGEMETIMMEIPWNKFETEFVKLIVENLPKMERENKTSGISAEQIILYKLKRAKPLFLKEGTELVTIEAFSKLSDLFGPLTCSANQPNMVDKIYELMQKRWFRSTMNKDAAFELLKSEPAGTYILRFSSGRNSFVISAVLLPGKGKPGKVVHIVVDHPNNSGWCVPGGQVFPTIYELLRHDARFTKSMENAASVPEDPLVAMLNDAKINVYDD